MSPKNAIKIINIQNSYSIHIGFIWSTLSNKLYSINSVLSSPLWSYSVHSIRIGPIRSTLVLFNLSISVLLGPLWSYSIHSFHFGSPQSYSVHFVHFGLFISHWSYLVHYVHFDPNLFICSYSLYFSPIQRPIWFPSVLFGQLCSIWSNSVHFDPLRSFFVHLHN